MKNIISYLSRMTLLAALAMGLLAGIATSPAFAKKKAAAPGTPATTETSSMAEGDKAKPEAKHHKEKKHHKGKKGEAAAPETTSPKQ